MGAILLAGDEARTRVGISRYLESLGHEVLHVSHFRLAARAADLDDVDAIVLGFTQHIRSREFVRTVRNRDDDTPIIAIVDSLAAWRSQELRAAGAQVAQLQGFGQYDLGQQIERLTASGDNHLK